MQTSSLATRKPAPMPPIPTKEVFQIALIGEVELCMTVNILYYRSEGPVGSATIATQAALATLFGAVGGPFTPYLACLSVDWEFKRSTIWCPTQPGLATLINEPGLLTPGTAPAGTLANQSAVTIQKTTSWRGKHGRGRISLPAVPRTWVTGTALTTDAAYKTLAAELVAPLDDGTNTFTPGIWAQHAEPNLPTVYGWVDLRLCKVNTILGTARRRKPGVGK